MSWLIAHKGWSSVFVGVVLTLAALWLGTFTSPVYFVVVLLSILVTNAVLSKVGRDSASTRDS